MFWEEKIDLAKKQFDVNEFKDPFYDGPSIVKTIINQFHTVKPYDFHQTRNKEIIIKNCILIKERSLKNLHNNEIEKLIENINYYLLLINLPNSPSNRIYDCQKKVLRYLLYLSSGVENQQFYILDKKYKWLNYFRINSEENSVKIFKSEYSI